ncbi:MAG: DUF882 domain-containing protein [Polyangiales bacterium]
MSAPLARCLVLALVALAAPAAADPDPVPVFLPPRAGAARDNPSNGPTWKKERAGDAEPTLRPVLATLVNVHTDEALAIGPEPTRDETALIARFLRDRTTWEEHAIHPTCMRVVRETAVLFQARRVEFISGYRSDKLNEHLRKKGHRVAQRSQHVLGNAVDFRLVGVPVQTVLRHLRATHNGGVGFYPQSGFLHADAGPRRRWAGQ